MRMKIAGTHRNDLFIENKGAHNSQRINTVKHE